MGGEVDARDGVGDRAMIQIDEFDAIYLHREPVDFRKWINGLATIVEGEMRMNPFSKNMFVFINRNRTRIKVLYWDRTGYACWFKRLEKDRFPWPRKFSEGVVTVVAREFAWLLEGYEFWKLKPHSVVDYACVS